MVKHAAATMNIRNQVQLICAIFLKILYPSHVKQPTAYITLIKKCDADHVDISGIKAVTEDDTVCTTFQARG